MSDSGWSMVMDDVAPTNTVIQQIEEAEQIAQAAMTRAAVLRQQHNVTPGTGPPAAKAMMPPPREHLEPQ